MAAKRKAKPKARKTAKRKVTKKKATKKKAVKALTAWPPEGLAKPAQRALKNANLKTLAALAKQNEDEVRALHGMGPNALKVLKRELKAKRLSFKKKS